MGKQDKTTYAQLGREKAEGIGPNALMLRLVIAYVSEAIWGILETHKGNHGFLKGFEDSSTLSARFAFIRVPLLPALQ